MNWMDWWLVLVSFVKVVWLLLVEDSLEMGKRLGKIGRCNHTDNDSYYLQSQSLNP